MIRRAFRRGLTLGLLAGAVASAVKVLQGRRSQQPPAAAPTWEPIPRTAPQPDPARVAALQEAPESAVTPPARKKPAAKKAGKQVAEKAESEPAPPWIEPVDGSCPGSHPIKGKLSSRIFHVPGGFNYPRTKPDRCYLDAAAAEADGLRPSKR